MQDYKFVSVNNEFCNITLSGITKEGRGREGGGGSWDEVRSDLTINFVQLTGKHTP